MFRISFKRLIRQIAFRPSPNFSSPFHRFPFASQSNPNPNIKPEESKIPPKTKENANKQATEDNKNEAKTQKDDSNLKNEGKTDKSEESVKKPEDTTPKPGFRDRLKLSSPRVSKCLEFGIHAWNLTFPKERYHDKFAQIKAKSKAMKKEEEKILTDEDLTKMQEGIPEWKRTAIVLKGEQQKQSLKEQISGKFRNKFNETEFAKKIYKSDNYKEFEQFKKEMHQFKEDFKDHIENSPNPVIQTSLGVYSKVSNESTVARAVKEMRNIDPTFDLYELEEDAKGIFEAAYTTYLQGDLPMLEKMCGEMALGYFKVLLRKMDAEKCEPKYKYLWQLDPAFFSTALIPEKRLPVFIFTIKTQEIHCNISKIDKRIVDGDDERLMNYEYSFAITPHQSPDLENVGHGWEIIELQPRQVIKMLI